MRVGGLPYRIVRVASAAVLLFAPLSLTACAASTTYAGIPLTEGAADPELQSLARRAQAGDKHAQLELGIRYEEGHKVPRNIERAKRLYELAAFDGATAQQFYSPSIGRNVAGQVSTANVKQPFPGLREARARLNRLLFQSHYSNEKSDIESAQEHGPLDKRTNNDEIWERLLGAIISEKPILPEDAGRIFGVSSQTVVASDGPIVLEPVPPDTAAPLFSYRRWDCEEGKSFAIFGVQCKGKGALTALVVNGPFSSVTDPDGRDEKRCPLNTDTVSLFQKRGWRLSEEELDFKNADALIRAGTELTKDDRRVFIRPAQSLDTTCLIEIQLYMFERAG